MRFLTSDVADDCDVLQLALGRVNERHWPEANESKADTMKINVLVDSGECA
jgi:hypothetical protein